jgi:hypothetical protein
MTELHEEALSSEGRTVLEQLGPIAARLGFHLGGGTAVASHLGHRRSRNFAWFSASQELDPYDLAAELKQSGVDLAVEDVGHGVLQGNIAGVRITFLRYRYPLLAELVPWPGYGCSIASLEDLACTTLAAAVQRGARQDFFDVMAICSRGIPLAATLQLYQRKFDLEDVGHVLMGLTYFDEADDQPDPDLLDSPPWDQVRATLQRWTKKLTR